MKKMLAGLLVGILLGAALGFYVPRAFTPTVVAFGVVEYNPPNPGATAVPPVGYYVTSMVFVDGLAKESVGKTVFLEGRLGTIPDSDGYRHYPRLFNVHGE